MKKYFFYAGLLLLVFSLQNCGPITYINEGDKENKKSNIRMSPNQVVVRFNEDTTPEQKQKIRDKFPFKTPPQSCSCGDDNLELWTINTDSLTIESAVSGLKGAGESESESDVEGEQQFHIILKRIRNFKPSRLDQVKPDAFTVAENAAGKVNIAILDTGIDYLNTSVSNPFLYNTENHFQCPSSGINAKSGWNFVNATANILDDHGHGTFVSAIITSELDKKNIGYQILPLKVFDANGRGSYWNISCAMAYINKLQQETGDRFIVNASFGGDLEQGLLKNQKVLSGIIKELEDQVLVITSAGNEARDTDSGIKEHFLSGYTASNILAVGGHQTDTITQEISLHSQSNYGKKSIDVTAPYENYSIMYNNGDVILAGTSFATAYITSVIAELYIGNRSLEPLALKHELLNTAIIAPALNFKIKDSKAIKK